jgi:hypothetical protein
MKRSSLDSAICSGCGRSYLGIPGLRVCLRWSREEPALLPSAEELTLNHIPLRSMLAWFGNGAAAVPREPQLQCQWKSFVRFGANVRHPHMRVTSSVDGFSWAHFAQDICNAQALDLLAIYSLASCRITTNPSFSRSRSQGRNADKPSKWITSK